MVLWRGNEAKLDCTGDNVIAVFPMMRLALEVQGMDGAVLRRKQVKKRPVSKRASSYWCWGRRCCTTMAFRDLDDRAYTDERQVRRYEMCY